MKLLTISTSLNPNSYSLTLVKQAYEVLKENNNNVKFLDIRTLNLPICDGALVYQMKVTQKLQKLILESDGIIMGCPIYNYNSAASSKNVLELGGKIAWQNKIVGLIFTAGGNNSFATTMSLAGSLIIDFKVLLIPKYVFATQNDFISSKEAKKEIKNRINYLANDLQNYTQAFQSIVSKS